MNLGRLLLKMKVVIKIKDNMMNTKLFNYTVHHQTSLSTDQVPRMMVQMRWWGSGRGVFGDGADVNHLQHWFTRSQRAPCASEPLLFICILSSTFLFGCKKKKKTHTNKHMHNNVCAHVQYTTPTLGGFPSGFELCR